MARVSKAKKEAENAYLEVLMLCFSISKKHHRAIEKYSEEKGLQKGQHRLILTLSRMGEACQRDLAQQVHLTPAAIAVNLKKLEKRGIIEKKISESDNRYNVIRLTDQGKKIVKESEEIFRHIDEISFKDFTEEEMKEMKQYLSRVEENLDALV